MDTSISTTRLEQEIGMRRAEKLRQLEGKRPSPVFFNYEIMKLAASQLTGYVKVKVDVNSALSLADTSPSPRSVRLGVMKQVASNKEITLEQMRILLGFAARKAQM